MIVYRTTVTRGKEVVAVFHSDDLTTASNNAYAVAESGYAVTVTTVVEAVYGEWEDTDNNNVVMRYIFATPHKFDT